MKWWAHSRLRTKIFLVFSALILVSLLVTLWFTQLVVSEQVQNSLRRELLTTGQVFQGLMGGVSDLDTVIRNPADSQHVRAIHLHIYNTTKSFWAARCTIAGIEVMHAIRKGQLASTGEECPTPAEQFYALAA